MIAKGVVLKPTLLLFVCLLSIESIRFSAAGSSSLSENLLISFRSGVSSQEASVFVRDSLRLRPKLNESIAIDPFHWDHPSHLGPRLRISVKPDAQLQLASWLKELKESSSPVDWVERTSGIQPLIGFANDLCWTKQKSDDAGIISRHLYEGARLSFQGSGQSIGIIDFGLRKEMILTNPTKWVPGGAPSSLSLDNSQVRLYVEGGPIEAFNRSVDISPESGLSTEPDLRLHGSSMAGIAAGQIPSMKRNGVAPRADLSIFDLRNLLDENKLFFGNMDFGRDVLDWLYVGKSKIMLNSWSQYPQGLEAREHDWISRDIDRFVFEKKDVLVISAVGSDSPISSGALAKNGISVGMSLSSRQSYDRFHAGGPYVVLNKIRDPDSGSVADNVVWQKARGPTPAGRIKPEIVAPGFFIELSFPDKQHVLSGSSVSSALIAGFSAILREYLVTLTGRNLPSAALMKASIIAAAVPLREGYLFRVDGNVGSFDHRLSAKLPNSEQGWGSPHLDVIMPQKALESEGYVPRLQLLNGDSSFGDRSISKGDTHEYLFCVVGGDAFNRLDDEYMNEVSATLVWTDPMGPLDDSSSYVVNDLDLQVHFEGAIFYGNGVDGGDRVNVIEKVSMPKRPSNQNATLKVVVKGVSVVEKQAYALVLAGHEVMKHSCESGYAKPTVPMPISSEKDDTSTKKSKKSSYMTTVILIGGFVVLAIIALMVLKCTLRSLFRCVCCKKRSKQRRGENSKSEDSSSEDEDSSSEDEDYSSSEDSSSDSSDSETSESRSFDTPHVVPAHKIIDVCEA